MGGGGNRGSESGSEEKFDARKRTYGEIVDLAIARDREYYVLYIPRLGGSLSKGGVWADMHLGSGAGPISPGGSMMLPARGAPPGTMMLGSSPPTGKHVQRGF